MDEYISREALLTEIAADYGNWIACNDTDESYSQGVKDNYSDTIRLINDIPAADVQPVKHGRWEHGECSVCGASPLDHVSGDMYVEVDYYPNYCPNCGSKNRMDGDGE